jgi:hypothetical protein
MESTEIKIKDYYKPDFLKSQGILLLFHLLNRFENRKAIIVVMKENIPSYSATNLKEVLVDKLSLYNQRNDYSAFWFYVEDLKKQIP